MRMLNRKLDSLQIHHNDDAERKKSTSKSRSRTRGRKNVSKRKNAELPGLLPVTSIDIVPDEDSILRDNGIKALQSRDQDDDSVTLPDSDRYVISLEELAKEKAENEEFKARQVAIREEAENAKKAVAPKKKSMETKKSSTITNTNTKRRGSKSRRGDDESESSFDMSLVTEATAQGGGCVNIIDGLFMCLDPVPEPLLEDDDENSTESYSYYDDDEESTYGQ